MFHIASAGSVLLNDHQSPERVRRSKNVHLNHETLELAQVRILPSVYASQGDQSGNVAQCVAP